MSLATWGRVAAHELARLVVVSPHLDDAVLGASNLLAVSPEPVVVTVFAGRPATYPDPTTAWDAHGGFGPGDDVVAVRREEDRDGLAELGATPVWLDHVDHQYRSAGDRVEVEVLAADLERALVDLAPTAVALPFGLGHDDHVATHEAGLLVRSRLSEEVAWFCYADTGYAHIPGVLAWRISKLFRAGLWPTLCAPAVGADPGRRHRAFAHYRSQVAALRAEWDAFDLLDAPVPETLWRLAPPPPGWEGLVEL